MKNLLKILGAIGLIATSSTPIMDVSLNPNNNIKGLKEQQNNVWQYDKGYNLYYGYELKAGGAGINSSILKWGKLDFNLGNIDPSKIDKFYNIGDSYSRTSWGSSGWNGHSLGKLADDISIFKDNLKNKKVADDTSYPEYTTWSLLNGDEQSTLARFKFQIAVGWAYYYEDDNYHLQFIYQIYGNVMNTFSNAYVSVNFGIGFTLE